MLSRSSTEIWRGFEDFLLSAPLISFPLLPSRLTSLSSFCNRLRSKHLTQDEPIRTGSPEEGHQLSNTDEVPQKCLWPCAILRVADIVKWKRPQGEKDAPVMLSAPVNLSTVQAWFVFFVFSNQSYNFQACSCASLTPASAREDEAGRLSTRPAWIIEPWYCKSIDLCILGLL